MLNHKFFLDDQGDYTEDNYIRVSDEFVSKMKPDLLKFKFTWNGYVEPQYGLNRGLTFMNTNQINHLKTCLLMQPQNEKEYAKLMALIDRAINEKKDIHHEGGERGSLSHDFVICDYLPSEINYRDLVDISVKIQDQFIRENYDAFSKVMLFWEDLLNQEYGFNYYGITIISPVMAQRLLDAISEYLKDNCSEKAEYFVGEEDDILRGLLMKSISENKFIIHFGV